MDETLWIVVMLFIAPCMLFAGFFVVIRFLLHWLSDGVTEVLSYLPKIYYVLGTLGGIVLLGFVVAISGDLSSAEIGGWIGYTVGGVLSMFAVGRVIQLLEQIRDAVLS